jgi:hypothetical protein
MPAGKIPRQNFKNAWIYNGFPGKYKIRRDWAGPQFLFSFAQGIKISPAFGAKENCEQPVKKLNNGAQR